LGQLSEREVHWVRVLTEQGTVLLNRPVGRIARDDLVAADDLEAIGERLEAIRCELQRLAFCLARSFGNCLEAVTMGKAADVLNGAALGIEMRLDRKRATLSRQENGRD
jgi:hypothetical protein